ncbi:unnamed protein product [Paramecium sonneborni]|uniref:Uncharacterized protein n=1 Tax=Paramecium sonneborni TaxID=65129 RepID=A0A8S1RRL4_9CILI|nr:unnamed protein product [Paramecium sonneborni]
MIWSATISCKSNSQECYPKNNRKKECDVKTTFLFRDRIINKDQLSRLTICWFMEQREMLQCKDKLMKQLRIWIYLKGQSRVTKMLLKMKRWNMKMCLGMQRDELHKIIAPVEKTKSEKKMKKNWCFLTKKCLKYDMETSYYLRLPYLADRLGHPEFFANSFQRLFRLESDMYHPIYNDQPFVQHQSADPDPTLNFEEGKITRMTQGCLVVLGFVVCCLIKQYTKSIQYSAIKLMFHFILIIQYENKCSGSYYCLCLFMVFPSYVWQKLCYQSLIQQRIGSFEKEKAF